MRAVQPCRCRQCERRGHPEIRVRWSRGLRHWRSSDAREVTHHDARRVKHVDREFAGRARGERIEDEHAVRRVQRVRHLRWQRRIGVRVATLTHCRIRFEEVYGVALDRRCHLPQRAAAVEHPNPSAVRAHEDIIVAELDRAIRRVRQVALQRLPVVTIIERDVHRRLCSGVEQSGALRVGAHDAHWFVRAEAGGDLHPALSEILRAVQPQTVFAATDIRDGSIGFAGDGRRHIESFDERARRHRNAGDGDVVPRLAVILRHVDQTIVRARPDRAGSDARSDERLDRTGRWRARYWCRRVRRRLHSFRIAQVGTDLRPVHAAVGRRHHVLEPGEQLALVPRREGEWSG